MTASDHPARGGALRPLAAAVLAALVAGGAVAWIRHLPLRLAPGSAGWSLVRGARADGVLGSGTIVLLPGLERDTERPLLLEGGAADGGPLAVGVSVDGGPAQWIRARGPTAFLVPPAATPGLRLRLEGDPTRAPMSLRRLELPASLRWGPWPVLAGLACGVLTLSSGRRTGAAMGTALGLLVAGLLAAAALPCLAWWTAPSPAALARLLTPVMLALAGGALAARAGRLGDLTRTGLVLGALVFGAWVRVYFLPSAGSWDTEYWKAWMARTASHGVTQAYGGPEAVPAGRFLAQMRGEEPLWRVETHGRQFVVDYPPLAMVLWRASWAIASRLGLEDAEARNVAVKLPAVAGDALSALLVLWALRGRPRRALALAAAYWALPVSWLSSAVLGFLDGACATLVAAAALAAGLGSPAGTGIALALACFVKPTSILVAPALVVALRAAKASWVRAAAWAIAAAFAMLLPFAVAGTLQTALVHCYRILFQGTLSGGFPNPWWILGYVLALGAATLAPGGPVPFAHLDALPVPARPLGTALFAAAAAFVCRKHRGHAGPAPSALAAATLFYSYGMLAIGVHENHPHPLFLLLALTGLGSARLRVVAAGASIVYVANMLLMSGLGRFYGGRYMAIEAVASAISGWRMALGFDATLLLAGINVALFAILLVGLGREMRGLAGEGFGPTG